MDRCQHCEHAVAPDAPYCPACGQPRMLASLLAPRRRPAWQDTAWRAVASVALAWFLVVACVAFLREAKALRVARQAIEIGQTERADSILTQFLAEHSEDDEGLFLAARAAVRLEDLPRTAELRGKLREEDADRLEELDADIAQVVDLSIRTRSCFVDQVLDYYDRTAALGDDFRSGVLGDMQQAVRRCLATDGGQRAADYIMAGLVGRKVDASVVEETYLVPLRTTLGDGRFDEAESLAHAAARISQETGEAMDPALKHVRGKVEVSIAHLEEVCRAISSAPGYRDGNAWCFPSSPPSWTSVTLDGWGQPFTYEPFDPDQDQGNKDDGEDKQPAADTERRCYPGFEVTSLGADGRESDDDARGPDADVTCRFTGRRHLLHVPDRFWRRQS